MISENKTLVILTPGFPESEADTTCLPMQHSFLKTLKKNYPYFDIIILSFQYPFTKKSYKWFDIAVIPFNGQNKRGLSKYFLRHKIYNALKDLNRSKRISGILSFWYGECALTGKNFSDKTKIKHSCWIFGQDARINNDYPKRVAVDSNSLVALSHFLRDEFEKNHNTRPLHVIPFGIDPNQFDNRSVVKDIDVLGVGSLITLKRFEIFIEIIAEVKKEFPGICTVIVGKGPEKETLKNLIEKYELAQNITLVGELAYGEVLKVMQRAKILLHPSSYEGFSGVCLEALQAGAHVISFCRAMNRDIEKWDIVQTKEEMKYKLRSILIKNDTTYFSSTPFLMSDTCTAIANLYL